VGPLSLGCVQLPVCVTLLALVPTPPLLMFFNLFVNPFPRAGSYCFVEKSIASAVADSRLGVLSASPPDLSAVLGPSFPLFCGTVEPPGWRPLCWPDAAASHLVVSRFAYCLLSDRPRLLPADFPARIPFDIPLGRFVVFAATWSNPAVCAFRAGLPTVKPFHAAVVPWPADVGAAAVWTLPLRPLLPRDLCRPSPPGSFCLLCWFLARMGLPRRPRAVPNVTTPPLAMAAYCPR